MNYLLVRESGGLGDVLRIGAPAKALHQKDPGAYVGVVCIDAYGEPLRMLRYVDEVRVIPYPSKRQERLSVRDLRKISYFTEALMGDWDEIVDLFCPAFAIEWKALRCEFDRMELYCMEAGCHDFTDLKPELVISPQAWRQAKSVLANFFPDEEPLAVIAPRGSDSCRALQPSQAGEIAQALMRSGFVVAYLDLVPNETLDKLGLNRITTMDYWLLGAFVRAVDVVVSVDTGAYHLAGAVNTPAVVLAGNQDPDVLTRHYPTHIGVVSSDFLDGRSKAVPFCTPPCTYNPSLGWSPPRCRKELGGCHFLKTIRVADVMLAVEQVVDRTCLRRRNDESSVCQHYDAQQARLATPVSRLAAAQRSDALSAGEPGGVGRQQHRPAEPRMAGVVGARAG